MCAVEQNLHATNFIAGYDSYVDGQGPITYTYKRYIRALTFFSIFLLRRRCASRLFFFTFLPSTATDGVRDEKKRERERGYFRALLSVLIVEITIFFSFDSFFWWIQYARCLKGFLVYRLISIVCQSFFFFSGI